MIELMNVTAGYGNRSVIKNISTTFSDGDFVCIVGRNGSGKSTLLKAIAGTQKYSGQIYLDNMSLNDLSRKERAREIGYLPQIRQIPAIDVKTLIEHGRFPHLGFSRILTQDDHEKVANAAELTSVCKLLHRPLIELSGGERQRVYLAMVIAQDTKTILLDEPTTYLDINHQIEVMQILSKLNKQGKTIIMVAHDLPQAFSYGSQIKVLDQGTIAAEGKPDLVCSEAAIKNIFGVFLRKGQRESELYPYQFQKIQS